ncbi:uncharacterized protein BJ171DRAFT_609208 [Polychytrium aggregatum]|uniref:uncharacterized protein n=1 Tax=Polychytrium aggregatum TaxID=110093 RepID=UPI0022FDF1A2|nr:uncharacterized protein BJ171DRAFT_609208 [Polychytrium aggregatum]KAI9209830.1 hypothetical protein BJ171DRAFT_609208 [Polychytrium aggregatum]
MEIIPTEGLVGLLGSHREAEGVPQDCLPAVPKEQEYDIAELDYSFLPKCNNAFKLKQLLAVLKSGVHGVYRDLEDAFEKRITELDPGFALMRPSLSKVCSPEDMNEFSSMVLDLKAKDKAISSTAQNKRAARPRSQIGQLDVLHEAVGELDALAVQVVGRRSATVVARAAEPAAGTSSSKAPQATPIASQKSAVPKDPRYWDKYNVEEELNRIDQDSSKPMEKSVINKPSVQLTNINTAGMSAEERMLLSEMEKNKGNEVFRLGEYEESIVFYSRSLAIMPRANVLTNRSLAYIKTKDYERAEKDASDALEFNDPSSNLKAHLRRGLARSNRGKYRDAIEDFRCVLELDPTSKEAMQGIKNAQKRADEARPTVSTVSGSGKRMAIVEVDDETESEIQVSPGKIIGVNAHQSEEEDKATSPEQAFQPLIMEVGSSDTHAPVRCEDTVNSRASQDRALSITIEELDSDEEDDDFWDRTVITQELNQEAAVGTQGRAESNEYPSQCKSGEQQIEGNQDVDKEATESGVENESVSMNHSPRASAPKAVSAALAPDVRIGDQVGKAIPKTSFEFDSFWKSSESVSSRIEYLRRMPALLLPKLLANSTCQNAISEILHVLVAMTNDDPATSLDFFRALPQTQRFRITRSFWSRKDIENIRALLEYVPAQDEQASLCEAFIASSK